MDFPQIVAIVATLKRGRDRLAKKNGWTQYAFARDADGKQVHTDDPHATSFCARGALHCERDCKRQMTDPKDRAVWGADYLLSDALKGLIQRLASLGVTGEDYRLFGVNQGVTIWNDAESRTVEQVLFLYDEALRLGEERLAAAAA